MNLPPGLPIPQEDWERTLLSVQAVVIALWQENQLLKQQVASLQQVAIGRSTYRRASQSMPYLRKGYFCWVSITFSHFLSLWREANRFWRETGACLPASLGSVISCKPRAII